MKLAKKFWLINFVILLTAVELWAGAGTAISQLLRRSASPTGEMLKRLMPNQTSAGTVEYGIHVYDLGKITDIVARTAGKSEQHIVDALFKELKLGIKVKQGAFPTLPPGQGAVVLANHPTGPADGLALIKLIREAGREDVKFLGTAQLLKLQHKDINRHLIPVPFGTDEASRVGRALAREKGIGHLQDGGILGIFPAGAVSQAKLTNLWKAQDPKWRTGVGNFLRDGGNNVVAIPVAIDSKSGALFQATGVIPGGSLGRPFYLGRNLRSLEGKEIQLIVGKPIGGNWKEHDAQAIADLLRREVEAMLSQTAKPTLPKGLGRQ